MPKRALLFLAIAACGGPSSTSSADASVASASASSASSGSSATTGGSSSSSSGAGGSGPGDLQGSVGGTLVDTVASAWFIGQSDDPAHTTVIYLFTKPTACAEISAPGWDKQVKDATGALEMKLLGTTPAKYPVVSGPTPPAGDASVNFTFTSKTTTPVEVSANGGDVELQVLDPAKLASGTFDLTLPNGSLKGRFAAGWCPTGHEP